MSDFICKRCGKCCGLVPFSELEYQNVKEEAKAMNISFDKGYLRGKLLVYFPKKALNDLANINIKQSDKELEKSLNKLTCPFLERSVLGICSCRIYEKRPEVCRLFGNGSHPMLVCPNTKLPTN